MDIYFEVGPRGARLAAKRGDVCIVVDLLRASTSITAAFMGGIKAIRLGDYPSYIMNKTDITAGEQEGKKITGFIYGNSPVELLNNHHQDQELLFFSTNGIPCINACIPHKAPILVGSLINADAVSFHAKQLSETLKKDISIILAGYHGVLEKDDLLAGSIIYHKRLSSFKLQGTIQPIQSTDIFKDLLMSPAGKRLIALEHKADIAFAAQEDISNLVACYNLGSKKLEPERIFYV